MAFEEGKPLHSQQNSKRVIKKFVIDQTENLPKENYFTFVGNEDNKSPKQPEKHNILHSKNHKEMNTKPPVTNSSGILPINSSVFRSSIIDSMSRGTKISPIREKVTTSNNISTPTIMFNKDSFKKNISPSDTKPLKRVVNPNPSNNMQESIVTRKIIKKDSVPTHAYNNNIPLTKKIYKTVHHNNQTSNNEFKSSINNTYIKS